MQRFSWGPFVVVCSIGCGGRPAVEQETSDPGSSSASSLGSSGTPEPGTTNGTNADTLAGESTGAADGPKYDVNGVVEHEPCETKPAGIYCDDGNAIECDGAGKVVSVDMCKPNICLAGEGCVVCTEGQFHCSGPRVMECDTDASPPGWKEIELCDPVAGEGCNGASGSCEVLEPLGGIAPTGTYFQYADFRASDGFAPGSDVDCFGDLIYVSGILGTSVDVYQVSIEDSDNDGEIEPNQHPDNPDEAGPIEQRTLLHLMTIPDVAVSIGASEIYALEDRIYVGGTSITEYLFGGASSVLTTSPDWVSYFAQIGYDDVNGVWYASNEEERRVFQYDEETEEWGLAFRFPSLAGDHMDGLEVVTDPNTGIPYVYVSDMTSDFIGQYRLDPNDGWVQQNLFAYAGTTGSAVEGMGFGAFNHFWAADGESLYEVGGGDLETYTEPIPEG